MPIISRNGFVGALGSLVTVPAGQSLVVANPGGGLARISAAAFINSAIPPIFAVTNTVQPGTAVYITYAVATSVLIEAPNSNDIEYQIGTAPSLIVYPLLANNGLVAKAGGGQAGATLLGNNNRILTVTTIADSCLLPSAIVGAVVDGFNVSANSTNIFPQVGDAINAGAANAAFAVAGTKGFRFTCTVAGTWNATLSA